MSPISSARRRKLLLSTPFVPSALALARSHRLRWRTSGWVLLGITASKGRRLEIALLLIKKLLEVIMEWSPTWIHLNLRQYLGKQGGIDLRRFPFLWQINAGSTAWRRRPTGCRRRRHKTTHNLLAQFLTLLCKCHRRWRRKIAMVGQW